MRHRAWIIGEFRRIGRALVDGTWAPGAKPMTVPQAWAAMAEALGHVVDTGVQSVRERAVQTKDDARMAGRAELNFEADAIGRFRDPWRR